MRIGLKPLPIIRQTLWAFSCAGFLAGCGGGSSTPGSGGSSTNSSYSIPSGPAEETYYGNDSGSNYVHSSIATGIQVGNNPYTITGTARYYYRSETSGAVSGPSPIRHAEVQVINSSGTVVLGTETSNTGTFSFPIPSDGQTYTIKINSRANNSSFYASVLNKPEYNQYYSVSTTFTASSTQSVGNIDASASNSTVIGAAFNIYDQIHKAHDYLVTNTTNCSSTYTGCTDFPGASLQKVTAYWTLGFNPGSYLGLSSVSFVTQSSGVTMLFILGGLNGSYLTADTDHWDNSVILHEYAHTLEYLYGETNSPGGSHNGNSRIDARLAWSEGFANYFQSQVRGATNYRDTAGTDSGSPSDLILISLATQSQDVPTTNGEGVFREFSVSRQLYRYTISLSYPFMDLWAVFNSSTVNSVAGFKNSSYKFRNISLFWNRQQQLPSARDISSIVTAEKTDSSRAYYDTPVTLASGCTYTGTVSTTSSPTPGSSYVPQSGNRYYTITHAGGTLSLALTCSTCDSADDLNLYVYKADHTLGDSSTLVAASYASNSSSESVSTTVAAGTFLVNVNRYAGSGTETFLLKQSNQNVCP